MEDALEAIHNRRSVRAYEDKAVPKDLIDKVIDAGLWAPSGMGRQSAIVVAVTDKEKISWLSELNRKIGGWKEGFDPFYGAPVVLMALGKKDMPTYVCDGSLMIGTMGVAAEELGLGSCWIHRAKEESEMPEVQEWLSSLGVPEGYEGVGHLILGYPVKDKVAAPQPRKDGRVFWAE